MRASRAADQALVFGPAAIKSAAYITKLPLGLSGCLDLAAQILLQAFHDIFLAYPGHLDAVLSKIKVFVCTAGFATQLLGKRRNTPLTHVLTIRKLRAAVVYEIQNQSALDLTALAAHLLFTIILGDPFQHLLHPYRLSGGGPPNTEDVEDDGTDETMQRVFKKLLSKSGSVRSVSALQLAKNTVEQHSLSETWRCSPPLTSFITNV
jgi:hypothetical protein